MGQAWGSSEGDDNWNADADVNGDDIVDLLDLGFLGQWWGRTCWDGID